MAAEDFLGDLSFKWGDRDSGYDIAQPSCDPRTDTPLGLSRRVIEGGFTPDTYNQETTMFVLGVETQPTGEATGPGNAVSDLTPPPQMQPVKILRCKVLSGMDTMLVPNPPNWQANIVNSDSILGSINQVLIDTAYPAIRYRPTSPGADPVPGDVISARYDHDTYRTGYFIGYPPESTKIIPSAPMMMDGGLGGLFGSLPPFTGPPGGSLKILWVGDSQSENTPLSRGFKTDLEARGAQVRILAKHGKGILTGGDYWAIENPSGLIRSTLNSLKPSLVIVELGGNDAYTYHSSATKYQNQVKLWMDAIAASGAKLIWLGPSYSAKPGYDPLRQKIRDMQSTTVSGGGGTWIDMVPLTKDLPLKEDQVHFVRASYVKWSLRLLEGPLSAIRTAASPAV